ncbi:MAG: hypothetical protein Q9160_008872 [Pyrenula sp. 1 TL-2023]
MDIGDFDTSLALDDGHRPPPKWTTQPRTIGEEVEQTSSDSHEHYHSLHIESAERATAADDEDSPYGVGSARPKSSSVSNNPLEQAILEMKHGILLLESQLTSASNNEDHVRQIKDTPATGLTKPSNSLHTSIEDNAKDILEQQQIIAETCSRPWSDFMNKVAGETHDYAIEIVVGEPEYHQPTKGYERFDRKMGKHRPSRPDKKSSVDLTLIEGTDEPISIPERIRINSPWILNTLANIDKTLDATGPMVMLKPFKFLVHYETQIKDSVRTLESQVARSRSFTLPQECTGTSSSETNSGALKNQKVSQDIEHAQTTLQHVRCLTDFMDQYIKPTINHFNEISAGRIQFRDLWYIFKPGEDVYIPIQIPRGTVSLDAAMTTPEMFQDRYNMMWRCTGVGGGRPNPPDAQSSRISPKYNPFKINCYYIDFDGKYFLPTIHSFSIMPFKGEREITSLNLFPARFLKDADRTKGEHSTRGKMVFDNVASGFTHYYYAGPTLTAQPCGCPLQKEYLHQEHVESEIIADFRMTLINQPAWRPKPSPWKSAPIEQRELQERYPVRYWSNPRRDKLENTDYDHIYNDNIIDEERTTKFRAREPIFAPVPSDWLSNENLVPEKDVILLTSRVFAFILRTRTFGMVAFAVEIPIKPQKEGLRNLKLRDDGFKDTIQALVRTHFIQKNAQQNSDLEYDVVRGKGKGLVILLHGAPGVGKSFTAESVAAANGRPLFQLTCGDLGLTPAEVEKTLREVFRYAQLWNCVLLLDECDIFLAQRSNDDIKRNSLVSGALNCHMVGVLDDAIKSRITWSAYYPLLDKQQTRKIWKVNIKLLEERNKRLQVDAKGILKFSKEHFISCADNGAAWNGRQIQNAFKVATALAEWDAYTQDVQHNIDTKVPEEDMPNQPKLSASHFRTIATGTQAFDSYLREATGFTEAERAFQAMERADDYIDPNDAYGPGSSGLLSPDDDPYQRKRPSFSSSPKSFPSQRRPSSSSKTMTTSPLQSSYTRDVASGGSVLRQSPTVTESRRRKSTSSHLQHQASPSNPSSGQRSRANTDSRKPRRPFAPQAPGGNSSALSSNPTKGDKRRRSKGPDDASSDSDSDSDSDTNGDDGKPGNRSGSPGGEEREAVGDPGDDTLSSASSNSSVTEGEDKDGEKW